MPKRQWTAKTFLDATKRTEGCFPYVAERHCFRLLHTTSPLALLPGSIHRAGENLYASEALRGVRATEISGGPRGKDQDKDEDEDEDENEAESNRLQEACPIWKSSSCAIVLSLKEIRIASQLRAVNHDKRSVSGVRRRGLIRMN